MVLTVGIADVIPKALAHAFLKPALDLADPVQAPFLLPTGQTMLRRALDEWFELSGVRPKLAGEFDDAALLELFGASGGGLFAAPAAVEAELRKQYAFARLAELPGVRERFYVERFYVLTAERRLSNPAIVRLMETARTRLFV